MHFALRQLRHSRGSNLVILLTLALCIGVNTAVYSVVDAIMLRPLPYPEPGRLALVTTYSRDSVHSGLDTGQNGTQFEQVRAHVSALDVAAYGSSGTANFASGEHVRALRQQRVSAGFFRVLGVRPVLGREFTSDEDAASSAPVALVSYSLWRSALGGNSQVLGRFIQLHGQACQIVGVLPRGFRFTEVDDIWTPLRPTRDGEGEGDNYGVIGRVKPGETWTAAQGQLEALDAALRPASMRKSDVFQERIVPLRQGLTHDNRQELLVPWIAVLLVLAIGCANVAGLLLARVGTRRGELATRLALGASPWAVIQQMLTESILLAIAGGGIGILIGLLTLDGLKRLGADSFALWRPIVFDGRVLLIMSAVALLTTLLFGLLPAIKAARVDIRSGLIENSRTLSGPRTSRVRAVLIVGEMALGLVLLVSAGLLIRTFAFLSGQDPGFDPQHVMVAQTSLQDARYPSAAAINGLFSKAVAQLKDTPGIESAAVALSVPYERPLNSGMQVVGQDKNYMTETVYASAGYFETLRIRTMRGRTFQDSDTNKSDRVTVVSERFARRHLGGVSHALGNHVRLGKEVYEVVGVVADVQQHSGMGDFGPLSATPTLYTPVTQQSDADFEMEHTWYSPSWIVRSSLPSNVVNQKLQQALARIDPQLPLAEFHPMNELATLSLREQRYHAVLLACLAGLGCLLCVVGLYGIVSQTVVLRTREMGIRVALGATSREVVASVMKPSLRYALVGLAIGVALSYGSVHLISHLIWGVPLFDPFTIVLTTLLLLVCALTATLIPALPLTHLDPARILRDE